MIWAFIPAWLRRAVAWAVAGLVAIAGAWAIGRRDGATAAKTKAAAKAADDLQTANEVRDENAKLSSGAVRDALGKWVRDPD